MKNMKKTLLVSLSLILVAALAIGLTLAYLTHTDSAVNVMTMGNVSIVQNEQERKDKTKLPAEDNLKEFTQNQPLLPAVYPGDAPSASIPWDSESEADQAWKIVDRTYDSNVIDKFVTVTNTGKTNAYVRTIIAYEGDPISGTDIHIVTNTTNVDPQIKVEYMENVIIDGIRYDVAVYTYPEILAPGETTIPSLKQIYMDKNCDNEDVEKYGDTYEILVLSQAVQADGFTDAETALDEAFGSPSSESPETGIALAAEWMGGILAANSADTWDGTYDTSWYNDTDTEFVLTTAEQLAGLSTLVDEGNTFEGKTIKLGSNMDFEAYDVDGNLISMQPIGSYAFDKAFKGTFDGQNYTVSNIYQSGWALGSGLWDGNDCGMGLFGLVENATVKDVNIAGMELSSEANLMGSVAGAAYGECIFENITVTDTAIGNHSYYSGGIVGWASGNHKYVNCDLDETVVIASQWGDFNNANGGIIGGAGQNGTYYMENCDVACVIDAFNDVTSAYEWYAYRNTGMLIGRSYHTTTVNGTTYAAAPNLTCVNCTVTYGDWANYTYCQFKAMGYPWVRVQEGYSTHAYGNARYDYATDAIGDEVKDANHTHNEGEGHDVLLVFDQLYGGPEGGVYGTASHEGVTVVYNNK